MTIFQNVFSYKIELYTLIQATTSNYFQATWAFYTRGELEDSYNIRDLGTFPVRPLVDKDTFKITRAANKRLNH